MKRWWRNIVKDYLTFSARERNGLIIFFVLASVIIIVSRYYTVKKPEIHKEEFQQELARLKITVDSSRHANRYGNDEQHFDYSQPKHYDYTSNASRGEVFAFDPNTLDAEGWKKLGVRDKTINTIQNFLAKGYRFRQAEDIRKIYGLRKQDADRLVPYVHIGGQASPDNSLSHVNAPANAPRPAADANRTRTIEINSADTAAFISLPGIGGKLASRIVNFRQKLGGFSSVNQLAETYGLPDSTFQRIKLRMQCNNQAVKKININIADINELRTHPYLKWNIANAIVNYRKQHGNYNSVEDLRKIDIINDDLFNKIAPYLTI
jgi:competence protein ComEA